MTFSIKGFPKGTTFTWPLSTMKEVVELLYGKALLAKNRTPGEVPVFGTNGITGWHDTPLEIGPTVVLGRKGMGPLGVEWCEGPFWVIDTAYYTRFSPQLSPKYFYYFTKHVGLNHLKDGTSNPSLTRDTFYCQKIPLPPPSVQQAIAHILGVLDDKIDLNLRMNETLEAMARAIFKSWFVDFDGCTEFEDSELGPTPKGWRVASLTELATLETTTVKPFEQPGRCWEHFSIPSFDSNKAPTFDLGESIKSTKYTVPPGSILVSKLNPQFPRVWYPDPQQAENAICSTEFMPFVPVRTTDITFLYEMMCSKPIQDIIVSNATGSTGSRQRVKPKEIAKLNILLPPEEMVDSFNAKIAPIHAKQAINGRQSQTLAQLRDTLLPKLISGELHIADAEKIVGDA